MPHSRGCRGKSRAEALKIAPWAAITRKVEGGYMCFESVEDFRIWHNQKIKQRKDAFYDHNHLKSHPQIRSMWP